MRERGVVTEIAGGSRRIQSGAPNIEAAVGRRSAHLIRLHTVGGEYLDDTAGGVAIERREWPTQHLHARRRIQIELRDLALPVSAGGRDTILIDADAADAERGVGADAAN